MALGDVLIHPHEVTGLKLFISHSCDAEVMTANFPIAQLVPQVPFPVALLVEIFAHLFVKS